MQHRYRFAGEVETVLFGLSHGVNALLHRDGEEHGQPDGSTVVARPGDEVETEEPYPHAHLVNIDTDETDVPKHVVDEPVEVPEVPEVPDVPEVPAAPPSGTPAADTALAGQQAPDGSDDDTAAPTPPTDPAATTTNA